MSLTVEINLTGAERLQQLLDEQSRLSSELLENAKEIRSVCLWSSIEMNKP